MAKAPPLKNDCFAMPPGVDWTPVDEALARLRDGLHAVVEVDDCALYAALGRIVARDITAPSSNPPFANSAVDGYGFAHASLGETEIHKLPLIEGTAAAGLALEGAVPAGSAVRILTGARLPDGVDSVVLEEDTVLEGGQVVFRSGLKPNANTRKAGEDVNAGDILFRAGHRMRPQDLALAAACGVTELPVYAPLRVAVLSTGNEITDAGQRQEGQIFDANRPMLLSMLARWGFEPIDLGHAKDDAAQIEAKLNEGAANADAILTSGGASAGDEDHISRLLTQKGDLQTWRIAVKPGRPLALSLWNGVPVFGLPGNPVAAFVCSLIFAKPAFDALSGAGWSTPRAMSVPAAFVKSKKQGRREYLRARLNADGAAEVFKSEGSGRISGLSWADGLVELADEGREIAEGDHVTYYPFAAFGL